MRKEPTSQDNNASEAPSPTPSLTSQGNFKILLLPANPINTPLLRLDQEFREIQEGLRRSPQREQFVLEQQLAVWPKDIRRAMLEANPHIVHFAGHGGSTAEEGLVFLDDRGHAKFVEGAALASLFELFTDQVECVLLNACFSEIQAEAIAQHISYVIGMRSAIGDKAAIEFSIGFYDALAAGRTIEDVYKFGCNAIWLEGIPKHLKPVLIT